MQQQYFANKCHRNVCALHAVTVDVWGYHNELYCSTCPYHDLPARYVHRCRHPHHKNQFRTVYRSVQSPPGAKLHAIDTTISHCRPSHSHPHRIHSIVRGNSVPFAIVVLAPWTIWGPCTNTRWFCTKKLRIQIAAAIDPIRRLHSKRNHAHRNLHSFRFVSFQFFVTQIIAFGTVNN